MCARTPGCATVREQASREAHTAGRVPVLITIRQQLQLSKRVKRALRTPHSSPCRTTIHPRCEPWTIELHAMIVLSLWHCVPQQGCMQVHAPSPCRSRTHEQDRPHRVARRQACCKYNGACTNTSPPILTACSPHLRCQMRVKCLHVNRQNQSRGLPIACR